jgi:hypothetical protein
MAPVTGLQTSQIRVAGTGRVLAAPLGTTAPANTTTAFAAAWLDLGYTDEKGVTFSKKDGMDKVRGWQSSTTLRVIDKEREVSVKFTLLQMNSTNLPLWGGGGAVVAGTGGEYTYTIGDTIVPFERMLAVEFTDALYSVTQRFIFPRVKVVDTQDLQLTRTNNIDLGLTFDVLPVGSGTPLVSAYFMDAAEQV